jgi:hypothetical protein
VKSLWSQSIARESLLGRDTRTMNPSIAARSLLGPKAAQILRRFKRRSYRSRPFYKGNPAPAIALALAGKIPGLKNLLKKHSDEVAAALAPSIVQSANAGNLTAARGLIERAAVPMIVKEHAVWARAAGQLSPKIVAAVKKYADRIPAADQTNPTNFAGSLLPAVELADIQQAEQEEAAQIKAERRGAAATAAGVTARREALIGGVAEAGLAALARRGRRPARRRRSYSY